GLGGGSLRSGCGCSRCRRGVGRGCRGEGRGRDDLGTAAHADAAFAVAQVDGTDVILAHEGGEEFNHLHVKRVGHVLAFVGHRGLRIIPPLPSGVRGARSEGTHLSTTPPKAFTTPPPPPPPPRRRGGENATPPPPRPGGGCARR